MKITKRTIELAMQGNKYALARCLNGTVDHFTCAREAVGRFVIALKIAQEGYPVNIQKWGERALYAIDNYEGQPLPWDYHGEKPITVDWLRHRYGDTMF